MKFAENFDVFFELGQIDFRSFLKFRATIFNKFFALHLIS